MVWSRFRLTAEVRASDEAKAVSAAAETASWFALVVVSSIAMVEVACSRRRRRRWLDEQLAVLLFRGTLTLRAALSAIASVSSSLHNSSTLRVMETVWISADSG